MEGGYARPDLPLTVPVLKVVALAVCLLAWLRLIALDSDLAKAEPKALR